MTKPETSKEPDRLRARKPPRKKTPTSFRFSPDVAEALASAPTSATAHIERLVRLGPLPYLEALVAHERSRLEFAWTSLLATGLDALQVDRIVRLLVAGDVGFATSGAGRLGPAERLRIRATARRAQIAFGHQTDREMTPDQARAIVTLSRALYLGDPHVLAILNRSPEIEASP